MSDELDKNSLPGGIPEVDAALEPVEVVEAEALAEGEVEAAKTIGSNDYFRNMVNRNFLEYASYVIKDRAIPNVDDGLKPVQRRILWAMHRVDENRTNKAAFVVGEVMGKYHPHGDASIKDALVVLANKEYFIEKQGNFGNIITGSSAAAARYIECGLTPLAREVLFNDDITDLVDTYDGRNREPVVLPVKIPALLMLGSDGIAVGMSTTILPHNFNELLLAQIAELHGESYTLYPDFLQGGIMDVREYADGNGRITLRARIEIVDRKLIIREIPATTTTESLIASIEKAAERNKIKISSVNDYTAQNVEVEVVPTRGYDPEKALQALYMYTDCSVTISPKMTVIRDFRPAVMTVTEVIKRNTAKLLEYLQLELENELHRQSELFHAKTLAQIFFENRIYKRIEECRSVEEEYAEVRAGLEPFLGMLRRDVTNEDIDKLLALPVRRIARFDIEKNQKELREIESRIKQVRFHLAHLKDYATDYLRNLLDKYGAAFPRRTEIVESLDKIDRQSAALNNIKIGWDRKNGYIGTAIKSDDTIICNEFDHLLCVEKSGCYKVTDLPPDKLFVGRLYECRRHDPETEFGIVYSDAKSGKYYGKRSRIGSFIKDREYMLCPAGCKLELLTPRSDALYALIFGGRGSKSEELNLLTLPERNPKARGLLISSRKVSKITWQRYLDEAEIAALRNANDGKVTDSEDVAEESDENMTDAVDRAAVTAAEAADAGETPVDAPEPVEEDAAPVATAEMVSPAVPPAERTARSRTPKKAAVAVPAPAVEAAPEAVAASIPEPEPVQPESVPEPVPVAPEMTPEETPVSEPAAVETPTPAADPAPESVPEAAEDNLVPLPEPEPVRKEAARKPAATGRGENDDLGLVQPEFGF